MDYNIFYKKKYLTIEDYNRNNVWDLFISGYNNSERVRKVFKKTNSLEKHWLIFPEYCYSMGECPKQDKCFTFSSGSTESELIIDYASRSNSVLLNCNLCIDITGFMRPHLLFLIYYLYLNKVKKFDVIYTDPIKYCKHEETTFTRSEVYDVRPILGFEGSPIPDNSNDLIIIGSGFDHQLIAHIAENKSNVRKKTQMFGFPSLQPDMFQQNLLRAYKAEASMEDKYSLDGQENLLAPANDPFVTASVIQEYVNTQKKITNLYLSPLSTKAQTLGFGIYYFWECINKPVSIIFPFCKQYERETTEGISKIWKYTVELP
ncbi:MAG: hypothetical protein WAV76_04595 [Bacteroidota bacterium]